MLSAVQERKASSMKQVASLVSLLLLALFGFLFFSSLHPVNAQSSINPSCEGDHKTEMVSSEVNCDEHKDTK